MKDLLNGKVAIITGGLMEIGGVIVVLFAKEGMTLVIIGCHEGTLNEITIVDRNILK